MLLVERGKLNLGDPVTRYVPEFTGKGELRRGQAPLKKFIEGAIKAELLFTPGTRQSYSSSATILVAEIIQRLSGKTIREFVRGEVIEPLGLKSTGLGSQGFARERL